MPRRSEWWVRGGLVLLLLGVAVGSWGVSRTASGVETECWELDEGEAECRSQQELIDDVDTTGGDDERCIDRVLGDAELVDGECCYPVTLNPDCVEDLRDDDSFRGCSVHR